MQQLFDDILEPQQVPTAPEFRVPVLLGRLKLGQAQNRFRSAHSSKSDASDKGIASPENSSTGWSSLEANALLMISLAL